MSREVLIVVRCDLCRRAETPDAPLKERTIDIDRHGPLRLDLCATCDVDLLTPIVKVLADHGVKPDPPASTRRSKSPSASTPPSRQEVPGGVPCPHCEAAPPNRHALGQHLRLRHDSSLAAEVRAGRIPPAERGPGGRELPATGPESCPHCDYVGATRDHLGHHLRRHHGSNLRTEMAAGRLPTITEARSTEESR